MEAHSAQGLYSELGQQLQAEEVAGDVAVETRRPRRVLGWAGILLGLALAGACIASRSRSSLRKMGSSNAILEEFSTETTFCYEKDSFGDCWKSKPKGAKACTPSSGSTECICSENSCNIDELDGDPPATGRCAQVMIYVPDGEKHRNHSAIDVTGKQQEVYCKNMTLNDEWKDKGLIATPEDGPPENDRSWLACWPPYTWHDGRCHRGARYIGEKCWNGWWNLFGWWHDSGSVGACASHPDNYDEYSVACYKSKCVPFAFVEEREECTCAWIGWNFIVACSAAGDVCGGHACVLNAGNGKKYCDYATDQNW
mmetsp:Transcript_34108/g.74245  ORF Transcript_34108/g.74245 Transcript_34108/m.74245 type:complete len:312 (-) Transcript_34108:178-1113(-)